MQKRLARLWCVLRQTPMWARVLVGLVAGIVVGGCWGAGAQALQPLGTMFINAIMMMVAPVVFLSLVCGVIAMKDPAKMGRVATKTFLVYFITTALGTLIALAAASLIQPGKGVSLSGFSQAVESDPGEPVSLMDTVVNLVPSNPVHAFSEGNVLQLIFLAVLLGVAINSAGEVARPVEKLFQSSLAVVLRFVDMIMSVAPIGIFALMASVSGTEGLGVLAALMEMVGVVYLCLILVALLVYGLSLRFVARLSPLPFFKKMLEIQAVAFSTSSSAATLPVSMRITEEKLGVPRSLSSFVLPLGATVNMNGLAACMGVYVIFAANLYGIELTTADLMTVVLTSAVAAVGCAGVPSAGMIVLPMVLSSVGLPLGVVGLITAVGRLVDMMSTTVNVSGDSLAAVLVAHSEGELDRSCYLDMEAAPMGVGAVAQATVRPSSGALASSQAV